MEKNQKKLLVREIKDPISLFRIPEEDEGECLIYNSSEKLEPYDIWNRTNKEVLERLYEIFNV